MTTEILSSAALLLRRMVRIVVVPLGALLSWFALSAGIFLIAGEAPAALVVLPAAGLMGNLPAEVRIVSWNDHTAVLTSARSDYVRELYKAGALLVLPARKQGCLSLGIRLRTARRRALS